MINKMILNPKTLFLIDGLGALLSAFLLGVILTRFETVFGMPQDVLYLLAFLPCLFAVYDLFCFWRISQNWSPFLKAIAYANLIYCCISIGFVIHHFQNLTDLGLIYFLLELLIIIILVSIELKMAAILDTR